ncbi:MAG: hypothetical protein IJR14_03870 [Synergistaceae bacterium]|nr:hypothetical protein [Synergistaceae bacterium]
MCISKPKVTTPEAPPKVEEMDATQSIVASRQSDIRRRQRALSRASTMTGSFGRAGGKTRLGE